MFNALEYIGFTSPRAGEWNEYGPEVLGLQVAPDEGDGVVRLRMDDSAYRISVEEGTVDNLDHLGWSVGGPREFEAAIAELESKGISVVRESAELAAKRCVADLASFTDPFGWRQELHWGLALRQGTFQPGRPMSGFVTAEQGVGHVALAVPDLAIAEAFYVDLLGFRLSDEIRAMGQAIRFYHCNSRHHSLALVPIPGMTGVAHLMLEARSLDDVGTALDAAQRRGDLLVSLGRHCNDHMVSFYTDTPSGVQIEYGWGAIESDPTTKANMIDRGDIWGHHPTGDAWPAPGILRPVDTEEMHA
ncbi:extradiol dioxygenase [Prauserella aidingensis]|uniref:VOC family protein n=1 Tax=Prauserella aidingensis TaxID=387890 RepID=UPI0020A56E58|nr:VOC family protein [Prauserella aidingensis]MCP2256263.1 extradiol dioxygenase [Prauserella aidingensis]